MMRQIATPLTVIACIGTCLCTAHAAVNVDWVTIGDAGNAADNLGNGSVAYTYRIGKYEVTTSQYTAFLNAIANDDPYGLYNPDMEVGEVACGILRSGTPGNYTYSVVAGRENKPVNYVSFWDACRFTNWMHNDQGAGDTETGAYTLTPEAIMNNTVTRNVDAQVFVTSHDEWVKAAYYKGGGLDAGYRNYANMYTAGFYSWPFADTPPGSTTSNGSANWAGSMWAGTADLTDVGAYVWTHSAYGTYDQTGNVAEWNEAIAEPAKRGIRDGSWASPMCKGEPTHIGRTAEGYGDPMSESSVLGFRIATIPEPGTLVLFALSAWALRRRR
ncbi:MAG: SUMF1/EgtB/PvdO family nonheme iron enzyme [Phycisphaerae bacterium]|nr:SUMF1/EgtB/PvdO family nonheme iron enzyme [Phycisphaerae bacterium]